MPKPNVIFYDEGHKYIRTSDNETYTSVTTFVSKYKKPFTSKFWLVYKAGEILMPDFERWKNKFLWQDRKKLMKIILSKTDRQEMLDVIDTLKSEWKRKNKVATRKGTKIHLLNEQKDIANGFKINPLTKKKFKTRVWKRPKNISNYSITKNLANLPEGFYPELLAWNDDWMLAGQMDCAFIEIVGGVKFLDIGDYKTNKIILKKESFQNPITGKYDMMLDPISHLMSNEWWLYCLQISLYAYMMEVHKYVIRNLYIQYMPSMKYRRYYRIPYLRNEIRTLLSEKE